MDAISEYLLESTKDPIKKSILNCPTHGNVEVFKTNIGGRLVGGKCQKCFDEKPEIKKRVEVHLPKRFRGCSFDNYILDDGNKDQRLAYTICKKYADNFEGRLKVGGCLILHGSCGTGKTHLACALVNKISLSGYTSDYSKVYDVVQSIKNTWSDRSTTEAEAMNKYLKPDLLIIDEVGMQFGSESEELILFRILNKRYEDLKSTIVISNLSESELNKFLGERIIDRFKEAGGANIGFKWISYRK